ncbi:hypothetical protein [Naasia sp. SYSU D00948]|uniref:hypothetical protein n=1 Tax=Naasia sp. SYSU D00948 TaxID=2817379 RepID=UPI001B30E39A|nr:hypothetical protein [Naasia sp. SYSU D00948]
MSGSRLRPSADAPARELRSLSLVLVVAIPGALLVVLGTGIRLLSLLTGADIPGATVLDPNGEANAWSWYSSLLLAALSVPLLVHAGLRPRRAARPFVVLAVLALCLSVDEAAVLHEKLTLPGDDPASGGWLVIQASIAVVGGAAAYLLGRRFDPLLRRRLVLAGVLYLSGAVGVEAVQFAVGSAAGLPDLEHTSLAYTLGLLLEEGLEVLGVWVALWAVLSALVIAVGGSGLRVERRDGSATADGGPARPRSLTEAS